MKAPLELKCEYAVDPLGVEVPQPRFSWVLESDQRGQMQSAYQILVASSETIRRELGWTPRYPTLRDIVETAWNWHQRHPNGYQD